MASTATIIIKREVSEMYQLSELYKFWKDLRLKYDNVRADILITYCDVHGREFSLNYSYAKLNSPQLRVNLRTQFLIHTSCKLKVDTIITN